MTVVYRHRASGRLVERPGRSKAYERSLDWERDEPEAEETSASYPWESREARLAAQAPKNEED